jgi:hypothetical protein
MLQMVIPIYDDFDSLQVLISQIEECNSNIVSFLIVDNGSTDVRIWERLQESKQNWSAVRTETNLGFGGGVKFGLKSCSNTYLGWMPGNLKIDPRDFCISINSISLDKSQFIKYRRVGRSFDFKAKTFISGCLQSVFMFRNMFDTGGTPTIIDKGFLTKIIEGPDSFVFESWSLWIARECQMKVLRPKIFYGERIFGSSHWQIGFKAEAKLMFDILKSSLRWKKISKSMFSKI